MHFVKYISTDMIHVCVREKNCLVNDVYTIFILYTLDMKIRIIYKKKRKKKKFCTIGISAIYTYNKNRFQTLSWEVVLLDTHMNKNMVFELLVSFGIQIVKY